MPRHRIRSALLQPRLVSVQGSKRRMDPPPTPTLSPHPPRRSRSIRHPPPSKKPTPRPPNPRQIRQTRHRSRSRPHRPTRPQQTAQALRGRCHAYNHHPARRLPTRRTTNGLSRRYTSLHSLPQARIRQLKPGQLTKKVAPRTQNQLQQTHRRHSAEAPLSHHIPGHDHQRSNHPTKSLCFVHFRR